MRQKTTAQTHTSNPAPTVTTHLPLPFGPSLRDEVPPAMGINMATAVWPPALHPSQAFGHEFVNGFAPAWGWGFPPMYPAFGRPAGGLLG